MAIDLTTGRQYYITATEGLATVNLPKGRYAFGAVIADAGSVTLAYQPNVSVPEGRRVGLDARLGRRVGVTLDDPSARQVLAAAFVAQHTDAGLVAFPPSPVAVQDFQSTPVYVTPTGAGAPYGPAFPTTADTFTVALREPDDTVVAALSLYSDARPGHASGARTYVGVTGTTELYQNGKLLISSDEPGTFGKDATTLSSEPGTYRLSVRAHRDVAFSRYATDQSIDWTFSSQHTTTQQNLPLLAVRYKTTLDPYGRAPAGRPCTVDIWLEANSSTQQISLTSTAIWASYDDGTHWQPVTVVTAAGQAHAVFTPPRSAKFVSLRATAHDQAGSSVDQTVIRAFGLI
jgi:hypothetical protein